MIAMRYGCVPLARSTGGLKDTIIEDSEGILNNGFLFDEPISEAMSQALLRALHQFDIKELWRSLQINGMNADFSWEKSALEYAKIYMKLIKGEK